MVNNQSHKYGSNSTLYNLTMKGFPLSSFISIWTFSVCFDLKKCPSAHSIYLSVSTNNIGIKSEIYGVMWKISPESKIQLFSCELSPKYLLGLSIFEDIHAIDAYIFCDSFCLIFLSDFFYIFFDAHAQVFVFSVFQITLFYEFSSLGKSAIQWYSDPHLKHAFVFRLLRLVHLFLRLREFKDELYLLLPFTFICCLKQF